MIVPTLLVGLGGIGSRIVDEIYGMIPGEERSLVAIHAFDTDVNDISKLQSLGDRVTQTSRNGRVGDYLNATDKTVLEWFPHEFPEIKKKTLTDGAGQIRSVSRLAFRAAIEIGAMVRLEEQVRNLLLARPTDLRTSFRVMIVSSIAGGTGSGLFLQMALYLQDLLEKKFHIPDVVVRGAFVLPDILIRTGMLPVEQHDNVRANAYASMKELYGIMCAKDSKVTIELEYKPGQRDDARGDRDVTIPPDVVPYSIMFLYDYENMKGSNLGGYDNYMHQVVGTIFLQLFSPRVAQTTASQEDNGILDLIANHGRSRFCSAGIATLTYPYEEIVKYFSTRWIGDSLSTQWLKIDEDYLQELRQWELDRQSGIHRPRPVLSKRYPELLAQYAADSAMPAFFKQVHQSLLRKDEHGEPIKGEYTFTQFLGALDEEICTLLDTEASKREQGAGFSLNEKQVKDKERSKSEIMRFEGELTRHKRMVEAFVSENHLSLANRILYSDNDQPSACSNHNSRLNTWLLKRPEPIHPVGVRSFLYLLDQELEKRLLKLAADTNNLKESIEAYEKVYDLPDTDYVETAVQRVEEALSQKWWSMVAKNKFKEFTTDYCQYSQEQLNTLIEYRANKLREMTYTSLRNGLSKLIEGWESFFTNLKEIVRKNDDETWRLGKMHEESGDPTRQYVMATRQLKDKQWDTLGAHLVGAELPQEICSRIYVSIYRNFCNSRFREGVIVQKMEPADVIFERDVVSWCRSAIKEKYQASLDLDVITALRREQEALGGTTDTFGYVKNKVSGLRSVVDPLCQVREYTASRCYWGINPQVYEEGLSGKEQEELFSLTGDAVAVLPHHAFSRNTLVCYKAVYGLQVSDFPKFAASSATITGTSEPAGSYFLAYSDRIKQVKANSTVTPHLDKRWHLHAYMPDINQNVAAQENEKLTQAFLKGQLYGLFRLVEEDKKKIWTCSAGEYSAVKVSGATVSGLYHRLYDALGFNPTVVDRVLQMSAEIAQEDLERYSNPADVATHRFYSLSLNSSILDGLYNMPFEALADDELEGRVLDELLPGLINIISEYYRGLYGRNKNSAEEAVKQFMVKLRAVSTKLNDPSLDGNAYHEGWKSKLQQFV